MQIQVEARVYLEDTDAGGIVYHTTYLRYMERARTELLRSLGFEQRDTFEGDLSFVVHSMNIKFHAPARLDERVLTSCVLREARRATLVFEQHVQGAESEQLHCSSEVCVACIALSSGRPRRLPPELVRKLAAAEG